MISLWYWSPFCYESMCFSLSNYLKILQWNEFWDSISCPKAYQTPLSTHTGNTDRLFMYLHWCERLKSLMIYMPFSEKGGPSLIPLYCIKELVIRWKTKMYYWEFSKELSLLSRLKAKEGLVYAKYDFFDAFSSLERVDPASLVIGGCSNHCFVCTKREVIYPLIVFFILILQFYT